jgi:SPASM domain peptide maturase of grasp-with-spasm system
MKVFSLFECCIPVKGASISIICDLQRNQYFYISEGLFEILTLYKNKTLELIKKNYNNHYDGIIDEYFKYLENEELGFWNDEPNTFIPINMSFESPEIINNCIIDSDSESKHDFLEYFKELDFLGCKFIELRFYDEVSISTLKKIMEKTVGLRFKNVDIIFKYSKNLSPELLSQELYFNFNVIGHIIVHSSPFKKDYTNKYKHCLEFIEREVTDSSCCGNIDKKYFSINIESFSESLSFNNCLNKKISIDTVGNIKNCPTLKLSHGHVSNNTLFEIVKNDNFSKYWNINKDQIETCKDCQFRYICSDCRAFVDNLYDKPYKCNYDPYKNKWIK